MHAGVVVLHFCPFSQTLAPHEHLAVSAVFPSVPEQVSCALQAAVSKTQNLPFAHVVVAAFPHLHVCAAAAEPSAG